MAGYYIPFGVRRGRMMLVLLASLEHLGGRSTKEKVLSFIDRNRFLHLSERDIDYTKTSTEPRWKNELAWAKKDALEHRYLRRGSPHGVWELSDKGIERLIQYRERLRSGRAKLRPGRLISEDFAKWFAARL
jgi:hypothetical protein